jgi:xanthine permease XanP
MFATIAVAGVKILTSEPIDRRKSLIIATSLGLGLGVMMVPDALAQLPQLVNNILSSSVTTAGFCAITMSILIPDNAPVDAPEEEEKLCSENLSTDKHLSNMTSPNVIASAALRES